MKNRECIRKNERRHVTSISKWMPCPKDETEYPGLAYILPLDEFIVVKQTDALHDVIEPGIGDNGCTIFNHDGQKVFLAIQEKHNRTYYIKIFNYYGNEVIQMTKPFKFCVNKLNVWAPPGNFIGSVNNKKFRKCGNTFLLSDSEQNVIMTLRPQRESCNSFSVISDDREIGVVNNKWSEMEKYNVKHFRVSFPVHMCMANKVVLLGACFLIGYLNYK